MRNLAARGVPRAPVLGPGACHARQRALLDAEPDGPCQLHDLDALLPDGVDLLRVGRHLVDRPTVDQGDRRGADAARRAHAVHGSVAGANDAHAGADRDRPALPHAPQERHSVDHAAGILARQAEPLRQLGAHGHEDRREPGRAQRVERDVDAGTLAVADLDAEALQDAEILVDLGLRQAVGGDRPADHAARVGVLLEDRDADAGIRQPLRGRQAGRPGPDDGDARGRGGRRRARGRLPLLLHDEALDLPDRQRLVQVRPDAGVLAEVVADPAQDGGQRVVQARDADRFGELPRAHGGHVAGHLLVHRALVEAGRGDAVEGSELARRLGAIRAERILAVAPVAADGVGVAAQVELRAVGDRARVARVSARERRPADEVAGVEGAGGVEGGVHLLRVLEHPQVAARLQEVRADGDGPNACPQEVGDVEAVGAAGERQREVAAELPGQGGRQVHRDRVERPAREVHRRVAVEDAAPVLHFERVRQLEPEREAVRIRGLPEAPEHRDRVGVLQVVAERLVRDRHIAEAEVAVDDAPHLRGAQQRRVALDRGVQPALLQQVQGDLLDLVGRAAVHRRERDRVGEASGDVDLADRRAAPGDDVDVPGQVPRGVGHRVEVPLHVRPEDPLQVVAHAHVEEHARALPREAQPPVERVDQDPGPQVLVERLVDLELLAPLDVVALVLHVDAGLVDLQLVEGLDGLQLDQARPNEPRGDDVLGHLGVRPGRHPERGLQLHAVLASPEAVVGVGNEECRPGHVEERALLLQLGEHPVGELLHRERVEPVGHR